jgi:predicted dehydrogenase
MPNERLILVGAGGISSAWFPVLKAEELNIVAVVDLKLDAAREKLDKYELKETKASDDLEMVLADTQADFLLDLTIPESHCDVTCKALHAGLHVIGEKPMAASMDQARKMLKTSEETGTLYMVSQSRRWESLQQSVAATVQSGALGDLTTVTCDFFLAAHFGGFRDEMPSPLLGDMSIHHFDMARLFTRQNAAYVYAEEYNPKGSWYKGAPAANCLFEMTDGVRFAYRASWCSEGCHTSWAGHWRLVGDKGTLLYERDLLSGEIVAGSEGFTIPKSPLSIISVTPEHTTMRGALREMLRFLRTGEKPQTECHDNIHSLAMMHAAIESAKTSKRVKVSDV